MSEENKAVVRRFVEEIPNKKNLDALDELASPNIIAHHIPPGMPGGFEGFKAMVGMVLSALPDAKMEIQDLLAEGDKVVLRWRMTGTHKGELMGVPASGNPVDFTGIVIERIENGKMAEHWEQMDMMGLMQHFCLSE